MTDHDPLCRWPDAPRTDKYCDCPRIALIRTDERERIAVAIEAMPREALDGDLRGSAERAWAYDQAARIARGNNG